MLLFGTLTEQKLATAKFKRLLRINLFFHYYPIFRKFLLLMSDLGFHLLPEVTLQALFRISA